jgi:hypothetical protein
VPEKFLGVGEEEWKRGGEREVEIETRKGGEKIRCAFCFLATFTTRVIRSSQMRASVKLSGVPYRRQIFLPHFKKKKKAVKGL